jgi:hypothetical protein
MNIFTLIHLEILKQSIIPRDSEEQPFILIHFINLITKFPIYKDHHIQIQA